LTPWFNYQGFRTLNNREVLLNTLLRQNGIKAGNLPFFPTFLEGGTKLGLNIGQFALTKRVAKGKQMKG